jgi:hypothetical protein
MNLIYTVLLALPIGLLFRPRAFAVFTYLGIGGYVFAFQTVVLSMEWTNGSTEAFGSASGTSLLTDSDVVGYGLVNLVITSAGVGLVLLGNRIRDRRRTADHVAVG